MISESYLLRPIGHIRSGFTEKFGIPRQPRLVSGLKAEVILEEEFSKEDAFRGIEEYSHLWLLFGFSANAVDMTEEPAHWNPLVRPPRLGGKVKKGVFATRSPYRPNSLGLSAVRCAGLEKRGKQLVLKVEGADLLDGTPIYDIKPYIPSDSIPEASSGFAVPAGPKMRVTFPKELLVRVEESEREVLIALLAEDPRNAYDKRPGDSFAFRYGRYNVKFRATEEELVVTDVETEKPATDK